MIRGMILIIDKSRPIDELISFFEQCGNLKSLRLRF